MTKPPIKEYLMDYLQYDVRHGPSQEAHYLFDDIRMALKHVTDGKWDEDDFMAAVNTFVITWAVALITDGVDAYEGGAHGEENMADVATYFRENDSGFDVYTECPHCDGFVGPRGCMDCNDPTGEYAREDERMEQYKDMKNW